MKHRLDFSGKYPLADRLLMVCSILRRKFYYVFRKGYIKEHIRKRKGFCDYKNCGACCNSLNILFLECKNLDKKTKQCRVYGKEHLQCHDYPFDEKDMIPSNKYFKCTYYWERK